jgi:hypothetical protein
MFKCRQYPPVARASACPRGHTVNQPVLPDENLRISRLYAEKQNVVPREATCRINDAAKIKDKSGMASERDEDWPFDFWRWFGNRAGRS